MDNETYRRRLVERLEGEIRDANEAIVQARADEARAHARVAEATAAIDRVRSAREPQADECKRCRFEFGRTSVLRPVPSKNRTVHHLRCALCGHEEERAG